MAAIAADCEEAQVNMRDSSNFEDEEIFRENSKGELNEINLEVEDSKSSVRDPDTSLSESVYSDEYAGQQASEITLRQLKLSALEDVLVCGQNRQSTESARRLFAKLSSQKTESARSPSIETSTVTRRWPAKTANQRGSSLSSHSSCCDDEQEKEDDEENSNSSSQANRAHRNIDYLEELLGTLRSPSGDTSQGDPPRPDDCGTIKLARHCCSSSSSSSGGNFGRTLVCSVSPTSRVRASPDDSHMYPIDGDEIRQCRTAFRENRRLIERVQDEASVRRRQQQQRDVQPMGQLKLRSLSQEEANQIETTEHDQKSHWASGSLGRRSRLPECSHCGSKLYPLDKMELDFTRTTLNIHRNCFRCQVCATLLRLETYASIDGILFCPAHNQRARELARVNAHGQWPTATSRVEDVQVIGLSQ